MNGRTLIYIVLGWIILTIVQYYFIPFFIVPLLWIVLSLAFLIISINQFIILVKERKNITAIRIQKVVVFSILFVLTFERWPANRLIENIDWKVQYARRMSIVKEIKQQKTLLNRQKSFGIYQLPYEFPVVSHGGNDVVVSWNKKNNGLTITFWTFRNFFSAPSTHFVYTDDSDQKAELESTIARHPGSNWKLDDHWYRTCRE